MNTSSSSESSCPPAELSSDASSDTGSESGTTHLYDDPKLTIPKAQLLLNDFVGTELYEGKSKVIIKLHANGNIVHGRLSKSIRKLISKSVVRRVVEKLSEGGKLHWNNVTWSLQIKQNIDIQADRFLCFDTMNEFFPEFKQSVVESLTQIDYIDEDELHFHATLTLISGRGTDHGDLRMRYKTRIIFTFMLKDGKWHKLFCFRHKDVNGGEQEAIRIESHEFVILDADSGGWNDIKLTHQAIAADCDILTVVVSLLGKNVPTSAAVVMNDWAKKTGDVRKLDLSKL